MNYFRLQGPDYDICPPTTLKDGFWKGRVPPAELFTTVHAYVRVRVCVFVPDKATVTQQIPRQGSFHLNPAVLSCTLLPIK